MFLEDAWFRTHMLRLQRVLGNISCVAAGGRQAPVRKDALSAGGAREIHEPIWYMYGSSIKEGKQCWQFCWCM